MVSEEKTKEEHPEEKELREESLEKELGKEKSPEEDSEKSEEDEVPEEDSEELEDLLIEEGENLSDFRDSTVSDGGLKIESEEFPPETHSLEESVLGESLNKWEEQNEEPSGSDFYKGTTNEINYGTYNKGRGNDTYTEGNRGMDLYSTDSNVYLPEADEEGGSVYSPLIEKMGEKGEVRQADKSKLEITGIRAGFSDIPKEGRGDKRDKKYYN